MTEKYDSGALHPSEVFETFQKLDVFDKEKFFEMLIEDEQSLKIFGKVLNEDEN